MKNILNRGFAELTLLQFCYIFELIYSHLLGNAFFVVTDPTLAALDAQYQLLKAAMLIVDPEAREQAVLAERRTLEQMLDDLADNLEKTANMDPVKLATTGFPLHKETEQTTDAPDIPQNQRLRRTGVSGEAQLLIAASDRAKGYEVQTGPDPTGPGRAARCLARPAK